MSRQTGRRRALVWWILTIVVAAVLFGVALNDTIYNLTSPPGPFQTLLRKSYSIIAFAIVGYLLSRALDASQRAKPVLFVAGAIAAYSLGIEIAQAIAGALEGLAWNAVDVAFGFVGGYIGGWLSNTSPER